VRIRKLPRRLRRGWLNRHIFGLEIPMLYIGTLAQITLKIFCVFTQSPNKGKKNTEDNTIKKTNTDVKTNKENKETKKNK